jgi:peptidoglycan/xylan/chitin deacetylase (PgdA/CDA1 family)
MTPARYLIRFDDLCPTLNWQVWDRIEEALIESLIRPILGIVPDNRDAFLMVSPPRADFWDRVRSWQTRGWTIGMHGYQHRSITGESGLIGINARSEFAGLTRDEQEEKLQAALKIFHDESVEPKVWLAPNHSFDANTVASLRGVGISVISDGLWLWPSVDDAGMTWIPHQIWRFHKMPFGVWTVGLHHNRWTNEQFAAFTRDLSAFRPRIVDVPTVLGAANGGRTAADRMASRALLAMTKAKRRIRAAGLLRVPDDAY